MKLSERVAILPAFGLLFGLLWSMTNAFAAWYEFHHGNGAQASEAKDAPLIELETRLRPLAEPKRPSGPTDWLTHHQEFGQTFADYRAQTPVGPDSIRKVIHLTLIGDFSSDQERILNLTRDYMERFFRLPVQVSKRLSLAELPARAIRIHPREQTRQILTGYVLNELLEPSRPDDAVASLAFTSMDLTPGQGWNFVFGEANLRDRTGVWSIHRFGDPSRDESAFRLCLRRTMNVATHECGHIFTIHHCIAYECNMNGSNHLEESDRSPLHYCPVCTRKLCWDLGLDPLDRFASLETFYRDQGFLNESSWCSRARAFLKKPEF